MFPQTLNLPPHFPPGFADGTPPIRQGLCANGKPYMTEPSTGQTICLCQLHPGGPLPLNAAHGVGSGPQHCATTTASVGVHLPPFRSPRGPGAANGFPSSGVNKDPLSMRNIPLGGPYTTAALAAYHPYLYAGYEMGGVRKAAVRETTGPLKAWLNEHRKNPYPTKAEKIMLAIITQMTLTQVSTWFANARRRLKKESRGNWDMSSDDNITSGSADDPSRIEERDGDSSGVAEHYEDLSDVSVDDNDDDDPINDPTTSRQPPHLYSFTAPHAVLGMEPQVTSPRVSVTDKSDVTSNRECGNGNGQANGAVQRPRIWSISEIIGLDEKKDAPVERNDSGVHSEGHKADKVSSSTAVSSNVPSHPQPAGTCNEAVLRPTSDSARVRGPANCGRAHGTVSLQGTSVGGPFCDRSSPLAGRRCSNTQNVVDKESGDRDTTAAVLCGIQVSRSPPLSACPTSVSDRSERNRTSCSPAVD